MRTSDVLVIIGNYRPDNVEIDLRGCRADCSLKRVSERINCCWIESEVGGAVCTFHFATRNKLLACQGGENLTPGNIELLRYNYLIARGIELDHQEQFSVPLDALPF